MLFNRIVSYQEVDSTNDEARRLIAKGAGEGTVVVAEFQTKGRGKPGGSWYSPARVGVYLSAIVKPFKNPSELAPITLLGARAVVKTIEQATALEARIKPPNDVLIGPKKVCGVLVERLASGQIIIGIGLNVNNPADSFPPALREKSTSLKIESGRELDLQGVRRTLIEKLEEEYLAYLGQI